MRLYFDDYFKEIVSEIISLSREVIDRATEIRARYEFKTPDAIHLDRFEEISVEVIQPS